MWLHPLSSWFQLIPGNLLDPDPDRSERTPGSISRRLFDSGQKEKMHVVKSPHTLES
jgi:hypothetical protein